MDKPDPTRAVPADTALAVYYDRSCPLCRHEIETLKDGDAADRLTLIDCSANNFSDPDAARESLSQCDLMSAIHVRDANGRWHTGPEAFGRLYASVGLPGIAALWASPRLRWLTERVYRLIARHRGLLRSTGLGGLYVRFIAWRLGRRDAQAAT